MQLSIRTHLRYATTQPCDLLLQVEAISDTAQMCKNTRLVLSPDASQQMIADEEDLILHHRDGTHSNNALANLVFYHPNCYFQVYSEPGSKIEWSRL